MSKYLNLISFILNHKIKIPEFWFIFECECKKDVRNSVEMAAIHYSLIL